MADKEECGSERKEMVTKVMAGCFALAAFAVAIFAGIAAGNSAGLVLMRALMAMILCYPVGFIVGMICERVIAAHAQAQAEQVKDESAESPARDEAPISSSEEVITV